MAGKLTLGRGIGKRTGSVRNDTTADWPIRPAEVWVRLGAVPMLLAAVWSHARLGWLPSLGLIMAVVGMALALPRLQPVVRQSTSWAARVCLAERLWFGPGRAELPLDNQPALRFLFSFSMTTLVGAVLTSALNLLDSTILLAATSLSARLVFQALLAGSLQR
ncbi:DUF6653 family protein [Desulfocurvibacter africanus]|uniref:DUF6653 family protein n=1 Tax=Desulfocurvibacter africanus TaxID=873 RepID=UPI002FDAA9E0